MLSRAIPHNSKCRYGERGAADAKPKAQIILDAAKVSAASGGNSEPKQGQRSQSARGFCPRSTMRVPQPDIIEHFGNADAVPQPPERCLSRKAGIVRCCLNIKGCLGLVFTFFCVIFVYLPLVYLKYSPFWTAVFVCFITTLVTMYLIGGPTRKTCAATLGTLVGVILAGVSAWCFSKASGISGYNVSDIETLMTLWNTNRIQVGGLLFSGLLISCLGAVMDVAMSISSAIDEIYRQNLSLSRKELFKAGLRVGRDMMGTDSNTLILAFAGSSVSTLLLDYSYNLPYQQIINSNNIGIAIMQGLAGSFGIVLSVPFTVLICTILFHKK